MDRKEIKDHLTYLAKQSGMDMTGIDAHLSSSINLGLAEFWNAYNWSFRSKSLSLDTSTPAESYDLPSWFNAIILGKEQQSQRGTPITFISKAKFDRAVPRPTEDQSGYPQFGTVYHDDGTWKIQFYPVPDVPTVELELEVALNGDVEKVPDKYLSGLMATIEKRLYPIGRLRIAAIGAARAEIKELELIDEPFSGAPDRLLDETDTAIIFTRPWWP